MCLCEIVASCQGSVVGCEFFEEGGEGATSVAEGEFGGDVEFGHGFFIGRKIEERVVAEALGSARCDQDFAFYGAIANCEDFAVAGCGEDAVITGLVWGGWSSTESFGEAEIVALV